VIYLYQLGECDLNEKNYISLNEYLVDNSLDSFISKLDKETKSTTLKDGGTKIYKKDDFTIVVCNKMTDGMVVSKDIHIGKDNDKNNNICDVSSIDMDEREK